MNILGLNIEILIIIGLCDTDNKMLSFRWMKTLSCVWLVTIELITYHFTVLLTRYRAHQWTQTGSVLWMQTDSHISSSSWWFFLSAQFFVTRKLFPLDSFIWSVVRQECVQWFRAAGSGSAAPCSGLTGPSGAAVVLKPLSTSGK